MFIGSMKKVNQVQTESIPFYDETIDVAQQYKYLEMMLDCHVKFDKHVMYIKSIVIPKMKTLAKIRQFISANTALYLYNSLIQPLLDLMIICTMPCQMKMLSGSKSYITHAYVST